MPPLESDPENRRVEPRIPVEGPIEFWLSDLPAMKVHGELVDISSRGLRARHNSTFLSTGEKVCFRHARGQGIAIIAWTRVASEGIESGFSIVAE